MASSDNFREQLKAGNLAEALALALTQATQLKITTWVASGSEMLEVGQLKPGHRLQTQINSLEGAIKNEIGDQFLGNGPYRELLQFHLDQVTQGNIIIQNNLKSLEKLFEVLVALRQQAGTQPTLELELPNVEPPPLLPDTISPEIEFPIPPPEVEVENVALVEEVVEVPESAIALEVPPDVTPLQTQDVSVREEISPLEEEVSPLEEISTLEEEVSPLEKISTLEELSLTEPDEDEDDSVLDLFESLPVPPRPTLDTLDLQTDEEWEDFAEEEPLPELTTSESDTNEDWGILELEDFEPSPLSPEPDIEEFKAQLDAEESDKVELELEPNQPIPSLDSLDLESDEDWDDWVVDEPETKDQSSLEGQEDEDWGDLVEDFDPFAATPPLNGLASDSDLDEDWDNFAVEELEPYSDITEVDSSFASSDPLADLSPAESTLFQTENLDLDKSEQLQSFTDESLDLSSQLSDESDWSQDESLNPMDVLFGESESSDKELDLTTPDDNEAQSMEEMLFNEMSFEEFLVEEFDPLAGSEDDWDDNPKSTEQGEPPPPPPPTRFPNRKN
ncbi:MAG TPA: hypothetical protein DCY91_14275 [Cyanobacteria bacterium UBA11370]|nr:hypothetical protein [Cyanobacteria bacterium UBA11370]